MAGVDGFALKEGRILRKVRPPDPVIRLRAHAVWQSRSRWRRRAHRAAHRRKGLNLALADVKVLAEILERVVRGRGRDALDEYTPRALGRAWKAQHFSYWMTSMLHRLDGASDFDQGRQLGELESIATSSAGSTYLAEAYTGWPTVVRRLSQASAAPG